MAPVLHEVSHGVIAVGVGSSQSSAATRYAAGAAVEQGLGLLVVHAYELPRFTVPVDQGIVDAVREPAIRLVREVTARLDVPTNMQIDAYVQPDRPAALLLEVARRVPLLVVGQDHPTWGERLAFGRVSDQVAGWSPCPVVVVPAGWRMRSPSLRYPVVVAVEGTFLPRAALDVAVKQAAALGTDLVVMRALPYRIGHAARDEETSALTEQISRWRSNSAGVTVRALVVGGDEDAHLLRWSKSAAAVVVQRPQRHWWHPQSQALISAVLKDTHSPLIIVPEPSPSGRRRSLGVRRRRPTQSATTLGW